MTLRNHCDSVQMRAHELLDKVKAGLYVDPKRVRWALITLGETAE